MWADVLKHLTHKIYTHRGFSSQRLVQGLNGSLFLCNTSTAYPPGASVASAPLNSKWFQSYCRAALESDPNLARIYVKNALDVLNETLNETLLTRSEREAVASAIHYLSLIEHQELRKVFQPRSEGQT